MSFCNLNPAAPAAAPVIAASGPQAYPEPTETLPLSAAEISQIRPRVSVLVAEQDANGNFIRQDNLFNQGFGEGEGLNPVEAGRYRLIWAKGCNWSNRASIVWISWSQDWLRSAFYWVTM